LGFKCPKVSTTNTKKNLAEAGPAKNPADTSCIHSTLPDAVPDAATASESLSSDGYPSVYCAQLSTYRDELLSAPPTPTAREARATSPYYTCNLREAVLPKRCEKRPTKRLPEHDINVTFSCDRRAHRPSRALLPRTALQLPRANCHHRDHPCSPIQTRPLSWAGGVENASRLAASSHPPPPTPTLHNGERVLMPLQLRCRRRSHARATRAG